VRSELTCSSGSVPVLSHLLYGEHGISSYILGFWYVNFQTTDKSEAYNNDHRRKLTASFQLIWL
jgi:hypothetical protein